MAVEVTHNKVTANLKVTPKAVCNINKLHLSKSSCKNGEEARIEAA